MRFPDLSDALHYAASLEATCLAGSSGFLVVAGDSVLSLAGCCLKSEMLAVTTGG